MNMSTAAIAANMPQAAKVRTRVDCVFLCITDSFVDIENSSINFVWLCGLLDAQEFYERKPRIIRPGALCTLKKYASSHIQTILSVSEFAHARHRFIHPKVVADYTAGGDLHPAPKNSCIGFCENCLTNLHKTYYIGLWRIVNIQLLLFFFFGR